MKIEMKTNVNTKWLGEFSVDNHDPDRSHRLMAVESTPPSLPVWNAQTELSH